MHEKRRIQFERYTNLPLGGNWVGEWPAYVLVHHEGTVDDVRYVPERTSAVEVSHGAHGPEPRFPGDVWTMHHVCSACGGAVDGGDRYCKHCGARFADNDKEDA